MSRRAFSPSELNNMHFSSNFRPRSAGLVLVTAYILSPHKSVRSHRLSAGVRLVIAFRASALRALRTATAMVKSGPRLGRLGWIRLTVDVRLSTCRWLSRRIRAASYYPLAVLIVEVLALTEVGQSKHPTSSQALLCRAASSCAAHSLLV